MRPVRDLDKYIGETMEFEILKYDRKRNNVVLSRKTILEKELEEQRHKVLENMEEGMVIEGIVKNITDYGLFVDLWRHRRSLGILQTCHGGAFDILRKVFQRAIPLPSRCSALTAKRGGSLWD